jgi:hypothetical protein
MAAAPRAVAESAVLECTADTWMARGDRATHGRNRVLTLAPDGAILLQFRTPAIEGWRISKATLLLHLAGGRRPSRIRVAPPAAAWSEIEARWARPVGGADRPVRTYQDEWIAIDLQPGDVQAHGLSIRSRARLRFDARESVGFAPYLLIEGSR